MSIRARHRWFAWLLPLFIVRAFVPAGFMLAEAGGNLQLMLCSGMAAAATQPSGSPIADVHGQHHHSTDHISTQHQHDHGTSGVHENSICPFAVAGSASAPAPVLSATVARLAGIDLFNVVRDPERRCAAFSLDRIRGPPLKLTDLIIRRI